MQITTVRSRWIPETYSDFAMPSLIHLSFNRSPILLKAYRLNAIQRSNHA
ncbi:MAG: hypothetical protein HY785_16530 [Oscillatoriophycideae cyanobacterium NC_groundwater_1537_Pr4_S-0.65um_50_18]|nr:hypothetical protein [Oscillatoriophycideae cyanobacterium NC_groundwater_1537_Pr4_S-0.65um_50_18]